MMELQERLTLPHTLRLLGPRATIMSGTPVTDAIENLKSRYLVSVQGAVNNLNRRLDRVRLLGLYHELFPEQFLASKASWTTAREGDREAAENNWGKDEARPHTAREMEFLELVNRDLFELPLDWIENGERLDQIMFYSPFGGWEEDEPDRYRPALQLAGCFLTDNNWMSTAHVIALMTGDLDDTDYFRHIHLSEQCDLKHAEDESLMPVAIPHDDLVRRKFWTAYERVLASQEPPVSYMNNAINLMGNSTGVTELDVSCMCGGCGAEFEWTRENVDAFAVEHKLGQEIFRRVDEFEEWLKADPLAHVAEMVVLWNYAASIAGLIELTPVPHDHQLQLFGPN